MAFPVGNAAWRGTRVGSGETSLPGGARGWPRFRTPPVTEASLPIRPFTCICGVAGVFGTVCGPMRIPVGTDAQKEPYQ